MIYPQDDLYAWGMRGFGYRCKFDSTGHTIKDPDYLRDFGKPYRVVEYQTAHVEEGVFLRAW